MHLTRFFVCVKFLAIFNFVSGNIIVENVTDPVCHGEGPHWDATQRALYFVDIKNQSVLKFFPETEKLSKVFIEGGPVGFVVSDQNDDTRFVLGRGRDIVAINWDGDSQLPSFLTILSSVDQDKPQNRFNDAKVDASGRLWAGTMGPENPDLLPNQGSLYSFYWTDKFKAHKHVSPVSISNGIAWNDENTLMYYIDSPSRNISIFDYDLENGKLSNQRVLFSLDSWGIPGFPDGMTIDREGNLWVAVFKGYCLLHINTTTGDLMEKITFPVSQVTSCAFGGKDLTDLYVTTSKLHLGVEDQEREPLAGSLFRVRGIKVPGQIKSNKIVTRL